MAKTSLFLFAGVLSVFSILSADVVRNPVNIGMSLEEFQLFEPNNYQQKPFDLPYIMVRPTGWIFESATIDERINLVVGIGATTFSLPHDSGAYPTGSVYENEIFPAVALVQASGSYSWGDVKAPALTATLGQMPYKYNSDALNMGEYLFRSTPYPNTVLNSPFDLVNAARGNILGGILNKNLAGGNWKNDLLFTSATSTFPLYDFSLAYVTSYRVNPILELGAGVNLFRLIPIQSKVTTHKVEDNAYFTFEGMEYSTSNSLYYKSASTADSIKADSIRTAVRTALKNGTALPTTVSGLDYYSFQGQMLMARFSIDLKSVVAMDLKLYGEWAMLGVQNYPVFYDKPVERMPIMVGLNIPTWGLLDILNAEVEYWKNPYLNSAYSASYGGVATPDLHLESYQQVGLTSSSQSVKDDDFKWSFSATKSMGKSFSITAKAARDHLQVMQFMQAGFPGKSYGDVISGKKSWYYVLRAQLAI